ncbi:hypothetical protein [Streptomyces sp. sk226]|uniref:hypothetical protein n=1 Tax=Streptomyces sp. sk226 TaxID=2034268 RepID=UPI000BF12611|nr:hypothetical protein [Streptomyces sp. sk226]
MKYRPTPGSGLAVAIETGTLLTACSVTILVAVLLENVVPMSSGWFLLVAFGSAGVGVSTGLALDAVTTAVLTRTGRTGTPKP